MGLQIQRLKPSTGKLHTLEQDTFITLDGKLAHGHEAHRILVGRKGAQILEEKALELGLLKPAGAAAPIEDKQGGRKAQNKGGKKE